MRSLFVASVVCWAAGCKSPAAAVPDAGRVYERGTDLHSVLTSIFPEYRGANVVAARAAVTRTLAPATDADIEQAKAMAVQNGFTGDPLTRLPFVLRFMSSGGAMAEEVAMGISPDEVSRIMSAPSAMTTESMAHWLPKVGPARTGEQFELELVWVAMNERRAEFLLWQVVESALQTGWRAELPQGWSHHRPDGGAGEVPAELSLKLENADQGVVLEIERHNDRARLHYVMTTYERK